MHITDEVKISPMNGEEPQPQPQPQLSVVGMDVQVMQTGSHTFRVWWSRGNKVAAEMDFFAIDPLTAAAVGHQLPDLLQKMYGGGLVRAPEQVPPTGAH